MAAVRCSIALPTARFVTGDALGRLHWLARVPGEAAHYSGTDAPSVRDDVADRLICYLAARRGGGLHHREAHCPLGLSGLAFFVEWRSSFCFTLGL
jgi:hypothetical protein